MGVIPPQVKEQRPTPEAGSTKSRFSPRVSTGIDLHVRGEDTEAQRGIVTYPHLVTSEQEFKPSRGKF